MGGGGRKGGISYHRRATVGEPGRSISCHGIKNPSPRWPHDQVAQLFLRGWVPGFCTCVYLLTQDLEECGIRLRGFFCMVPAIQALSAGVAAVALLQHLGVTGCLQ